MIATGHLKQGTPLCLRLLNACSTSFTSLDGSIRQNEPFPGSSWERGTLTKYLNLFMLKIRTPPSLSTITCSDWDYDVLSSASPCPQSGSRDSSWWYRNRYQTGSAASQEPERSPARSVGRKRKVACSHPENTNVQFPVSSSDEYSLSHSYTRQLSVRRLKTYCFRGRVKIGAVWWRKLNARAIIVIVLAKSRLVQSKTEKWSVKLQLRLVEAWLPPVAVVTCIGGEGSTGTVDRPPSSVG